MEQYLIYLRKSRADREAEAQGAGDTLERHRTALLALAKKMNLSIAHIYEEVVSGESISARPEMQKLLRAVETGDFAGVLVMEVERLARGATRDQGIVSDTFRYSDTKIITPLKTYDTLDESDEEYFEFGLFMSRREYKTINRRIQRGRMASIQEGKYIAGQAPYGYKRVKLKKEKGYTLEIEPDKADVIRHIFDLYVNGDPQPDGSLRQIGSFLIAKKLDAEGIPSPSGRLWQACTVTDILRNPTYAGMIRWSYRPTIRRMVDGDIVTERPVNKDMPRREGKHEAIIDKKTYDAAQTILSSRAKAPVPKSTQIKNPLVGIVYCSDCGRSMERRKYQHGREMLICPNKNCSCKGSVLSEVEAYLFATLRGWLEAYSLEMNTEAPDTLHQSVVQAERMVAKMTTSISTIKAQQSRLYDFLEQGVYTTEVFLERSQALAESLAEAEQELDAAMQHLKHEQALSTRHIKLIPAIRRVLELYHVLESPKEKNDLLKEVIDRALYQKTVGGRWEKSDMHMFVFPRIK